MMRMAGAPEALELLLQPSVRDLLYRPEEDSREIRDLLYRPEEDDSTYELLTRNPSFDVRVPKIPGRDLEGVPNAPGMNEKLRRRLLKNPDGSEDLPGFLKKAQTPGYWLG
jgi:hypothetical protein